MAGGSRAGARARVTIADMTDMIERADMIERTDLTDLTDMTDLIDMIDRSLNGLA